SLLGGIGLMEDRLIERDLLLVVVAAIVLGIHRVWQELADVHERVHYALTVEVHGHVEGTMSQSVIERTGREHALRDLQSDLAPFVDQPGPDILVGLVDVAIHQLEFEPLDARLLEQTPRLLARFADIRPEPSDLLELLFGRREWRARENDAGHRVHGGDLGERRGAVPAVDRQSKGPADPNVVERLALVVRSHQVAAVPIAGLDRDLVAE